MTQAAVALEQIGVRRGQQWLLRDVDLRVEQGLCCAVIGPNGAGKSTLIAVLAGYIWPTTGRVTVLGRQFGQVDLADIRSHIGLIEPSRMPAFNPRLTTRQIVATGLLGTLVLGFGPPLSRQQWRQVDSEIDTMHLTPLADEPFGRLSTGERTKALIARALVAQPALLILDEPTAGLDMAARAAVVQALENRLHTPNATALIVVSHHLEEIPYPVDQIVLLQKGRVIAQGPPDRTLTSQHLSQTFGCNVRVWQHEGRYLARVIDATIA